MATLRLGVFASGRGSNFQAMVDAVQRKDLDAEVRLLLSDNEKAGVLALAKSASISTVCLSRKSYPTREAFVNDMLSQLQTAEVDFIALAGYMKMIPVEILSTYLQG